MQIYLQFAEAEYLRRSQRYAKTEGKSKFICILPRCLVSIATLQASAACSCSLWWKCLPAKRSRSDRQPATIVCCRGALWRLRRRRRRQPAAAPGRRAAARVPQVRSSRPVRSAAGSPRFGIGPSGPCGPQPGGGGGPQLVAELARTPQAATRIIACSRCLIFIFHSAPAISLPSPATAGRRHSSQARLKR